jgi:hypothetical protein
VKGQERMRKKKRSRQRHNGHLIGKRGGIIASVSKVAHLP